VVSIFPNEQSLTHLVGGVLEHYYLTWAGERYMSADSMLSIPGITPLDQEAA